MPTRSRYAHWPLILAAVFCAFSLSGLGLNAQLHASPESPALLIPNQKENGTAANKQSSPNVLEIIKVSGAAIAFCVGLWQYSRAQRWKRVEFVASEMKSFFNDESTKAAMFMLDWSQKEIELYRHRKPDDDRAEWVTYEIVASALNTHPDATYDEVQSPIREIFDSFLGSLERFESFIESGVVDQEDLRPYLHYWTKLISGNDEKFPLVKRKLLPQLCTFAAHYRYKKVLNFVNRYDKLVPELQAKADS
ncbi:MAG TPA: hypothetical protein VGQ12_09600 [Candidatus Angelobacter sp.]|jgi:hypothetical protein|nr:hypothetical protein [Candidatus Angelobacter sp.]